MTPPDPTGDPPGARPEGDHPHVGLIREVPGQRRVSRTVLGDRLCVTRVLLHTRLSPSLGPLVEKIVLLGHGSMLGIIPEDLQLTLEGYRVAARLPTNVGPPLPWTRAVAAGVDPDGYVTISTGWIEGTPLHHVPPPDPDDARARALDALRILVILHGRLVTYGDFKSENLVLRPDGTIALIDLDTLREVAEPTGWAPTRDLTRSWAAPEQEQAQRTYLPSDLWSWARLVEHLFPAGPPAEWRTALEACRIHDPLRRPRTDLLLAHLELGSELADWLGRPTPPEPGTLERGPAASLFGATERVPERGPERDRTASSDPVPLGATERVAEGVALGAGGQSPPATPPRTHAAGGLAAAEGTGTTATTKRSLGCVWWFLGAVATPIVLCGGLGVAWTTSKVEAANVAAEDTLGALKAHKTRPELNRDRTQREILRGMADDAVEIRATPRSTAVRALATVWAQGWQDSGQTWDPEKYDAGMSVVAAALGREPESRLAFATLETAACRLDRMDAAASVHCRRALDALADVEDRLPDAAEHHWLRVEAAWTELLVRSELVAQAQAAGLPEITQHLEAGTALCTRAEPWLPYAPVNGPELLQDCLRLAGAAGAVDAYVRWGDLLVTADMADGTLSTSTMKHIYQAGGGCESTTVDKKRGDWQAKGSPWCVAVGHAARGCRDLAWNAALEGRLEDPSRAWNAFGDAVGRLDATTTCVR